MEMATQYDPGPLGGVWEFPPQIRLPQIARKHDHAEIVFDDERHPDWARCTWCNAQSRFDKNGGELAEPCRTWCSGCDLVTREEIHSGEVANPDYPGMGRDLPDGHWLCPRCA